MVRVGEPHGIARGRRRGRWCRWVPGAILVATLACGDGTGADFGVGEATGSGTTADPEGDTNGPPDPGEGDRQPPDGGPDPCDNGVRDGNETDVDCGGGACWLCLPGQRCTEDLDCSTLWCEAGTCGATACNDDVRNGRESGRDCGGPDCPACADGRGCVLPTDCASGLCREGVCVPPDCVTDADCEGVFGVCSIGQCDGGRCTRISRPDRTPCNDGCSIGVCSIGACVEIDRLECESLAGLCEVASCEPDGLGCRFDPLPDGMPCDSPCWTGGTCLGGECEGLTKKDCSALDGPCVAGVCDNTSEETRGECTTVPANDGAACDDGDPATTGDRCVFGACQGDAP